MIWHDKLLKKFICSKGFVTSVDLTTEERRPIRFVIWDTDKSFRKANGVKDRQVIARFYDGADPACLGLICLSLNHIGAGIVSHEIFHLAEHLQRNGWESEHIADTIQVITSQFWGWFQEVFKMDNQDA